MEVHQQGRNEHHALVFGLVSVLLWSTVATGFKLGLAVLSVTQLVFTGTLISWALFLAVCIVRGSFRIEPSDRLLAIGLGLLNPCTYYLILFAAYDRLPAYIAQPLNYTWAITLSLLAVPILKQHLTLKSLGAICLSYLGVVILLTTSQPVAGEGFSAIGILLALLSTVFWATYWLLNTKSRSDPLPLMFWSFSAALPVLGIIVAARDGFPAITGETLFYGSWVGFLEMGISFLTWQHALRLTGNVSRISQLIFLSPFLSLLLIYYVLEEPFGIGAVAGLFVILLGVRLNQSTQSSTQ